MGGSLFDANAGSILGAIQQMGIDWLNYLKENKLWAKSNLIFTLESSIDCRAPSSHEQKKSWANYLDISPSRIKLINKTKKSGLKHTGVLYGKIKVSAGVKTKNNKLIESHGFKTALLCAYLVLKTLKIRESRINRQKKAGVKKDKDQKE